MHTTAQAPRQQAANPSLDPGPVELIAFDIDNTLVDIHATKQATIEATVQTLRRDDLPDLDPDATANALYEHALKIGIDHPRLVASFLEEHHAITHERVLNAAQRTFERLEPGMVRLYPDTIRTLDTLRLRGYRLYAVTDAPRDAVHRRLPANGLSGRFDRILVREDTPHGKADPTPFQQLLDGAGAKPRQLLAVGDHPVRDVSNAIQLGAQAILATHGTQSAFNQVGAPHDPTATVHGLAELLDLLPNQQREPKLPTYRTPSPPETTIGQA